ncbi:adenylate/guanylate cyclase domain-containing protein, partial [Geminicoccus flavidas]|uniref:adenylate/guanylate cyclase domain-containing protein n=1 Tax=Geminicoccus flavidas TaxID=2506407 RepID=UPI00190F9001
MERKLAAIIAGDVVGYSRLMAEDEAQTYGELRTALREIVEPAVQRHGGRTFKHTGDGFLTAFGSVNAALEAAIEIQRGFSACPLDLRLGLNLGDVIEEDGDIFGDGVNVANRLQAMAEPGSIYASATVVRSADKEHVARFRRIGRRQAKNIPEAIEVYAWRPDEMAPGGLARLLPAGRRSWPRPRSTVLASICAGILVTSFIAAGSWTERSAAPPAAGSASGSLRAAAADSRPTVAVLPFDDL